MTMKIVGTHEDNTLAQLSEVDELALQTALMADGHLGYCMPIGGVAAYDNLISPMGIGFDIACGNCAIKTSLTLDNLTSSSTTLEHFADTIVEQISFGMGGNNKCSDSPKDHELFDSDSWKVLSTHERDRLKKIARNQLGTVGSGNHYVDVFFDEDGNIWVGVHFGSRGMGHKIATGFLNFSQGKGFEEKGSKEVEFLLDAGSPMGEDYWELMNLAGEYAYAGRDWVAMKVACDILGGEVIDYVHNHHNFAWKEVHTINGDEREVIVVRKGATPAFPGQRGFVGGSMGDDSVILEGKQVNSCFPATTCLQKELMYSTVHGAGRVMGRSMARGARNWKTGKLKLNEDGTVKRAPMVKREDMDKWVKDKGVVLRGGDVDESPHVYRRLNEVLKDQGPTITVLHTLTPLIVVMAGCEARI